MADERGAATMTSACVNPLDHPALKSEIGVADKLQEIRLPITQSMVHVAILRGDLKAVKIANKNYLTYRAVFKWVESLGIPIDWEAAAIMAKLDIAQRKLVETGSALAEFGVISR